MHFKIIIPFWNVEQWIPHSIKFLQQQSHKDFQCILIDDCSTDRSLQYVQETILSDHRFLLYRNNVRSYALKNIVNGIKNLQPNKEDVIFILDGDDWLATTESLKIVSKVYEKYKCWLTYGSYREYPSGNRGIFCQQLPRSVIDTNSFRQVDWMTSQLRTFKFWLWELIDKKDLLNNNGKFYQMSSELSFMFPMLEMCGDKSQFVENITYIYNLSNPKNDHKIDSYLQGELYKEIRCKEPYYVLGKHE